MKLFSLFEGKTFKIEPDLDRIRQACKEFANPENKFPSILVAGTNGKGSTCAFLESLFRNYGFKTGLFTSPHLVYENERWQINRKNIEDKLLDEYIKQLQPIIKKYSLTYFEASTLLAFKYFADENVDIAILEVGLGGRWDATNVVEPKVSVITNVSYDHMHMLGDTLEKIAFEKTGITRKNVPAVIGRNQKEILYWLKKRKINEYYIKDKDFFANLLNFHKFDYSFKNKTLKNVSISLIGDYQTENASTALTAFLVYLKKDLSNIDEDLIKKALKNTFWPARLQKLKNIPPTFLDGAHNEEALKNSFKTLKGLFKDRPIITIFSGMKDKNIEKNLEIISNNSKKVIITKMPVSRGICKEDVKDFLNFKAIFIEDLKVALKEGEKLAKEEDGVLFIVGSLYLAGEILKTYSP